jgi:hypothetical protein
MVNTPVDQIGLKILTLPNWMIFYGKLNFENSRHETNKRINVKGEQNTLLMTFHNTPILESKHKNTSQISSQNKINLTIFHQNVRGLCKKTNEMLWNFLWKLSHVPRITEHHWTSLETQSVSIDNYTLAAHYCRKQKQKRGVCTYVKNNTISMS